MSALAPAFIRFHNSHRFQSPRRIFAKALFCAFACCAPTIGQTPQQQYVYASVPLSTATSEVAAFSKDSASGALTPLTSAPATDKLEGGVMAVDALGRFVFVLNPITSYISMFQVDRNTGALAEVPASPFSAAPTENPSLAPTSPTCLAVEASGQFLYVGYAAGNFVGQGAINAYFIDATNLQLVPLPVQSTADIDAPPMGLFADPKGRYLYAGLGPNLATGVKDAETNVYKIDPLTGSLALNGYAGNAQAFGRSIALDPAGRFFFEAWGISSGFINSAAISPVDGSALTGISTLQLQPPGELSLALLAESTGKFLYVQQSSGVATYVVDQATGALTQSQPPSPSTHFALGTAAADPLGPYLYALQPDGIHAFQIDPQFGALTPLPGSPFTAGSGGVRGIAISGTAPPVQAVSGPVAAIFPSSHDFGPVTTGQSSSAIINITNTGNQALLISSITVIGANAADFAATPNCAVALQGGTSCTVSVAFSPSAAGPRQASLSVADNAPASPQVAQLTGAGVTPQPAVTLAPGTLTFAATDQGSTTAAQSFTLTNSGAAPLHIASVALSGANTSDFLVAANTCNTTITINGTCTIGVAFSPSGNGSRTASILIADDAPQSPQSVQLTGTGTGAPITRPAITIAPTSIGFPTTTQGTVSPPQTVAITSAGSAPLHISTIALAGTNSADFTLINGCTAAAYSVSTTCTLTVTFTPSVVAVGPRSAMIAVADDAPGSPQIIQLGGLAQTAPDPITNPGAPLNVTGTRIQTVKAGQTATYNLQLMPGFTGSLAFTCAGAPPAATCAAPSSLQVTTGVATTLPITISTTAPSTTTAGSPTNTIPALRHAWRTPLPSILCLACILLLWSLSTHTTPVGARHAVPAPRFFVFRLSPRIPNAIPLTGALLILALSLTGCGGGASTAQSLPVTQTLATPQGTSIIVVTPTASATNGKPVGTITPIQLTLTVQ